MAHRWHQICQKVKHFSPSLKECDIKYSLVSTKQKETVQVLLAISVIQFSVFKHKKYRWIYSLDNNNTGWLISQETLMKSFHWRDDICSKVIFQERWSRPGLKISVTEYFGLQLHSRELTYFSSVRLFWFHFYVLYRVLLETNGVCGSWFSSEKPVQTQTLVQIWGCAWLWYHLRLFQNVVGSSSHTSGQPAFT